MSLAELHRPLVSNNPLCQKRPGELKCGGLSVNVWLESLPDALDKNDEVPVCPFPEQREVAPINGKDGIYMSGNKRW